MTFAVNSFIQGFDLDNWVEARTFINSTTTLY